MGAIDTTALGNHERIMKIAHSEVLDGILAMATVLKQRKEVAKAYADSYRHSEMDIDLQSNYTKYIAQLDDMIKKSILL